MDELKLLSFPTTTDEKIQRNIELLRRDLWSEESAPYILEIMHLCKDYIAELEDCAETDICLVNLNTSIICLAQYMDY